MLQTAAQGLRDAQIVVDASALEKFDSSALAVLLECRRDGLAVGKTFAVQGMPPRLRDLAILYGVASLLPPPAAATADNPHSPASE
ncbi:MAG: STAS domain-containing protein [Burkholderiaceae bacterium]|jgi:phospholipid transport system transporter-binding protein|nr:STAS domain-containing protein [Burkholderiaceae bacterium]